jgi:hypothetical protein
MKLKNFNNLLQEVILLKKKLFILEPQIEKSIEIIFRTLKKKKKKINEGFEKESSKYKRDINFI